MEPHETFVITRTVHDWMQIVHSLVAKTEESPTQGYDRDMQIYALCERIEKGLERFLYQHAAMSFSEDEGQMIVALLPDE